MIKETICMKEKKTSLTVTNNEVTAVLRSNIKKTGIRLYDNNCIGIAGAIGDYNDDELTKNAKGMLNFKVPYDAAPTENVKREMDLSKELAVSDEEFIAVSRKLLKELGKKYPMFVFRNKIDLIETEESLINSVGTALTQKDRQINCTLLYKYKDSKNLMDGGGMYEARNMDYEQLFKAMSDSCEAYENKIDFAEKGETIPVVILGRIFNALAKFYADLSADSYANGASLFSGKAGEKLFSDKFSFLVNRDAMGTFSRFFDGEGIVLPGDCYNLIENGVLKTPYTTKRTAKQYNLPITGVASMEYDSVPSAAPLQLTVAKGDKTLKELLMGRKAIYIVMASGGDFTPQGEYAAPIQAAYLYDGENYIGRLPQLSMSSNLYDMFGKDFIGLSSDSSYPGSPNNYLVFDMNVKKIDGWM